MPGKSLFPAISIEDAQQISKVIAQNAGQPMRRLAIFQELERSPDSGAGRGLVTASSGYGLTTGGYTAEYLKLTDLGRRLAVDGDQSALIDALLQVDIFKKFFETYKNNQVPSAVAAKSFLADNGIPPDRADACLSIVLETGRYAGLIATMSGSERVLSRDHAIEQKAGKVTETQKPSQGAGSNTGAKVTKTDTKVLPSLNINLEIHLPDNQSPEVYDAIFSSMRKHLLDAG